jgi:hypothetical protein
MRSDSGPRAGPGRIANGALTFDKVKSVEGHVTALSIAMCDFSVPG